MIDFNHFYQRSPKPAISLAGDAPAQVAAWQREALHGKFREWERAVEFLPELAPYRLDLLHSVTAESETPLSEGHRLRIENLLKNLMPWRKGPWSLYGVNIDTEWRSDWKWERVLPHLSDLTGRTILDVGCGSGYHMWRMIGAGRIWRWASIPPSCSFASLKRCVNCWATISARIAAAGH
jgi:tRNA (mo5U34)-methyltransferase